MEFVAMKRRDLLELCRQHGLAATRGSKADLATALAGALSFQRTAAAAESVVGVVVGKGCLKRLGGSASGVTSGASKKVRFTLDESSEVKGRRRRSQVILSKVVAKTRRRRKARKALPSAAASGRGRQRKRNDGAGSAHESVTREVGADAPVTQSRMKVVCLHAPSGVESQNNPAEAQEGGEVIGTATGRKQKRKAQENAEVIANSRAGISRRITRSLSSSPAAVLLPLDDDEKRGAWKLGHGCDELSAEEHAAGVHDLTIAASPVIIERRRRRSSRKGEDCIPSVQKPSKVVISCRTTRLSSVAADVILPTVIGKKRKTRGRPKAKKTLSTTTFGGRGSQQKCDVADDSVDHGAFGEVSADALVTQFRTKAVNLREKNGVESQNNLAEAEEEEEAVEATTYRKQKRNAEDISANAPSGISHTRTRKSSSSPTAVLLSSVVEKMELADEKDELGLKELAEVEVVANTALPIIAESRGKRKEEDYVPAELKPAKMEFYGRTRRAHSIAAAVLSPTVIGSKVRKAEDVHPNGEVSTDLEVLRNDAPTTKSLRNNIVVQVNSIVVDETCVREKLEIKRKPSRPATHRKQSIAPSVEEKEQVVVPCKFSQHRPSSRNRPQADELLRNTDLKNNKLSRVPVGGKDLSIAHRLTRNTVKTRLEDVESLSSGFKDRITRSYKDNIARNGGHVSLPDGIGNKASAAEMALGLLDERTKGMHESVSNKEFQNAKAGDVGKQPAVRGCVRRSTRKSATSVRI